MRGLSACLVLALAFARIEATIDCPAPPSGDPAIPHDVPNPDDCTTFYKCTNWVPVLHDCPAGLHWRDDQKICDWPAVAGCTVSSTVQPTKPTTPEPTVPVTSPEPSTEQPTDSTTLPTTVESSTTPSTSCPAVDPLDHTIHLPHETDCDKFYKCLRGVPYIQDCPAGLHWNTKKDYCDYPSEAKCSYVPEPSNPSTDSTAAPPVTGGPSDACPAKDPEDPTHPVHLPHESRCDLFYKCLKGVAYLHECPAGLHWNPAQDNCDWPANAKCTLSTTAAPETTPSAPTTAAPETTPSAATTAAPPTSGGPSDSCPAKDPEDPTHPVHLPHESRCDLFYKCLEGVAYLHECPAGLHWNPAQDNCDWPENAKCTLSTTGAPQPTSAATEPSAGTTADPPVTAIVCPQADPENINKPIHLPHENQCDKFYKCLAGIAYIQDCPAGLHWNSAKDYCDFPSDAKCSYVETPEPEPSTGATPSTGGPSDSCPAKDPEDPTHPVHLPHESRCDLFYKCLEGVAYLHECPAGLHWNAERDYCDYPANVKCTLSTTAAPETTPTVPTTVPTVPTTVPTVPTTVSTVPTTVPTVPTTVTTPAPSTSAPFICPPISDDPQVPNDYYNPDDCNTFFRCASGTPVLETCPSGLFWNDVAKYCDYSCVPPKA